MVLPTDDAEFRRVITRVPEFAHATDLNVRPLPGGLSNTSYLVDADGAQFVVRIVGQNGPVLVSDRAREEATVPRLAARLREVHALPPIEGEFDPYGDIRRWLDLLDARGMPRPSRLAPLLARVGETERQRISVRASRRVLCHNDPYHLNFLDDGSLWLIDWEYAGMGDPMYDLASIGYTLDREGRDLLLESYFGSLETHAQRELDALIDVVLCWKVVWSLIQSNGGVDGFDYPGLAEELLDSASHL